MSEQDVKPDPPLTPEQALRVSRLRQEDLWEMDRVLLAQSTPTWRKLARIVGMTIGELSERFPNIPDVYYAQRVRHLVAVGKLESQGNLAVHALQRSAAACEVVPHHKRAGARGRAAPARDESSNYSRPMQLA